MGRIADLGLLAAGRIARVAPCADIPTGSVVELPGRGSTYVVDTGPPPRRDRPAPTVVLLHALACTGLLTWYPSLERLRERYRVIVFDQRWHGQGIASPTFGLEDCADDVAAVADALGLDRVVVAGYSMGSLVAQLAWHQHPDRVSGVVMCASTARFVPPGRDPAAARMVAARISAMAVRRAAVARAAAAWQPGLDDNRWAIDQFRSTTGRQMAGAAAVISRFDSSPWISSMDVPAAVVVTSRDRLIAPARQRWLAARIPAATVYEVDAGHAACVMRADRFTPALLAACASVSARAASLGRL